MELSKEVHGLLDRIKRLSNAQKPSINDSYSFNNMNTTYSTLEEIEFIPEDIIPLDNFDVTDKETWLYVSEESNVSSAVDVNEWVHQDLNNSAEDDQSLDTESDKYRYQKNVDTRTFTRPKKRISRPSLESISDSYSDRSSNSKFQDLESLKIPENPFSNFSLRNDVSISTGPLHFKLSDPVMNHSFDKILLTATDGYDSFQNMSPPSLMNSLCSSTFNTLEPSFYSSVSQANVGNETFMNESKDPINIKNNVSQDSMQEIMSPLQITLDQNDSSDSNKLDSTIVVPSGMNRLKQSLNSDQSNDLNITSTPSKSRILIPKTVPQPLNITYEKDLTDSKSSLNLNSTFQKNNENKNLNSTFTSLNRSISDGKIINPPLTANNANTQESSNSTFCTINSSNSDHRGTNSSFATLNKSNSGQKSLNITYTTLNKSNSDDKSINSTSSNSNLSKNNSGKTLYSNNTSSSTNTFTKKARNITNLPEGLKKSCPDINRTYQGGHLDKTLTRTLQKLSDSQPNLTKEVQQTIFNQSMELMSTEVYEGYYNARSASTDSLDDKSSTVSSSSKDSTSKILNMGDLDNLARLQEQSLQQVMSTPKPKANRARFWEADGISPIHQHDDSLSEDSDLSDPCLTARSRTSRLSSSTLSSRSGSLTKLSSLKVPKTDIKRLLPPEKNVRPQEVSQTTVRNLPTMVVKPLEVDRTFKLPVKPQIPQPAAPARPRVRASGLPRPTAGTHTGIPRPTSRIPGPRLTRPQITRPTQRPVPKTDWMDGCY